MTEPTLSNVTNIRDAKQKKPPEGEPAGELIASVVARLNCTHSIITMGGSTSIMNESASKIFPGKIERSYSKKADIELRYSNELHSLGLNHVGKPIIKTSAAIWLHDPDRRQYNELFFDPRHPPGGNDDHHTYNLFCGWPIKFDDHAFIKPAKAKKWKRIRDHLLHGICRGDVKLFRWLCAWIAERLKRPHRTAQVAVVLLGGEGAGKGTFAKDIVGGCYHPQHFTHVIDQEHLFGRFNNHIVDALFVYCDEAFFAGDPRITGRMKGMISESHILLEAKFKDPVLLPNMRAFAMASNDMCVVNAGIDARRFAVFQVDESHKCDHQYFAAIREELSNGGREEMIRYLLQADFSDVNPYQAPMTRALMRQKELGFSPVVRFWFDLLRNATLPEDCARGRDWSPDRAEILSSSAALHEYRAQPYMIRAHESQVRAAETVLGIELKRLIPSSKKKQNRAPGGNRKRYWLLPSLTQARAEFDKAINQSYPWDEDEK